MSDIFDKSSESQIRFTHSAKQTESTAMAVGCFNHYTEITVKNSNKSKFN